MFKSARFAVVVVTVYLLVYTILFHSGASFNVLGTMFLLSPFLVIWMVYVVLRYGKFDGQELKENEEWGYSDRDKEELGVF